MGLNISFELITSMNSPSIVLIRHGHRESLDKAVVGSNVHLTEVGKRSSYDFGKLLKNKNVRAIKSSPLLRCMQTAYHIKLGMASENEIEESNLLGDPGCFVTNTDLLTPWLRENGNTAMVRTLFSNSIPPGMRKLKDGFDLFYNMLHFDFIKMNANEIIIYISHDSIIAAIVGFLLGGYSKHIWPGFLEGLTFTFSENTIKPLWLSK